MRTKHRIPKIIENGKIHGKLKIRQFYPLLEKVVDIPFVQVFFAVSTLLDYS